MALSPASLAPPTLQPQSLKAVVGARCSFPPGEILVVEICRFTAVPRAIATHIKQSSGSRSARCRVPQVSPLRLGAGIPSSTRRAPLCSLLTTVIPVLEIRETETFSSWLRSLRDSQAKQLAKVTV